MKNDNKYDNNNIKYTAKSSAESRNYRKKEKCLHCMYRKIQRIKRNI